MQKCGHFGEKIFFSLNKFILFIATDKYVKNPHSVDKDFSSIQY
jgi:hypothetical protein